MPDFVYVGDQGRVYPSLPAPANGPVPGETYSLKKDPGDGRWQTAKPAKKAPAKSPAPDPAPAGKTKE